MRSIVASLAILTTVALSPVAVAGGRDHGGRHRGYDRSHHRGHHGHGGLGVGLGLGLLFGSTAHRHSHYPNYDYQRSFYSTPYAYRPLPLIVDERPWGEIDTDIKPNSATVYLDGEPVGLARELDGWPTKLRVSPGRHELVFRESGFQPLQVVVEVLPYHSVRIDERMIHGRDDMGNDYRGPFESAERYQEPPARRADAAIVLDVDPADATVYLNGQVMRDGQARVGRVVLPVSSGEHRIEVVKPGYRTFSAALSLSPRQRQELSVRLERD